MDELFLLGRGVCADWDPEEWICMDCVDDFLRHQLHIWWLDRKMKDGSILWKDCPKGYDCVDQIHDTKHARDYNHLCEPAPATITNA
ncbi:hypothetical protein GLOTRDRAFT_111914 [Gloeophyllum trabeum ATCC 11539]|uniref:Uncharacterized protein n=1 Tax=Gloeophyllum trabeum (strain ATCC 11539 / FP-39264 / Madison 617) TaxID=670483 RepID=S7RKQ4_GLOTA|nr:uncharacterized protein GLOTRDRAFT_111914 [Gloeophyllum trabeum ATCC 11539]EPQ53249.1 hypothetical protein GLOTRDRAFT_111914 [Gloeophyllum trabeum ATCC 11539]